MNRPAPLPIDTRKEQCERAADYMEKYPGSTGAEIGAGADLGSATKVISEMESTFGYLLRREWDRVPTRDGLHSRGVMRYWLVSRPVEAQGELLFS